MLLPMINHCHRHGIDKSVFGHSQCLLHLLHSGFITTMLNKYPSNGQFQTNNLMKLRVVFRTILKAIYCSTCPLSYYSNILLCHSFYTFTPLPVHLTIYVHVYPSVCPFSYLPTHSFILPFIYTFPLCPSI